MENGITEVLAGRRVESVGGGERLDLRFDGAVTVRVAHEFRFTGPPSAGRAAAGRAEAGRAEAASAGPSVVERFFPALTFRPTPALLALVGRTVRTARITPAGGLEVGFAEGGALSVPPHALVAPWSVLGPGGAVCAGLAGGEVRWTEPGGA